MARANVDGDAHCDDDAEHGDDVDDVDDGGDDDDDASMMTTMFIATTTMAMAMGQKMVIMKMMTLIAMYGDSDVDRAFVALSVLLCVAICQRIFLFRVLSAVTASNKV